MVEIRTIFLEDYKQLSPHSGRKKIRLFSAERATIESFMSFRDDTDWAAVVQILPDTGKIGTAVEFLKSKMVWDILVELYDSHFSEQEFNLFYWTLISMYLPLFHLMQSEGLSADIYHPLSTGYAGLMSLLFSLKYQQPLVLTEHGIYAREREEEIINAEWVDSAYKKIWIKYFYFLSRGVYKHAVRTVALFENNSRIQQQLGLDRAKALVIPNGVDLNRNLPRGRLGDGTNIGAILRVVPIKDVKTLIKSFRLVQNALPPTKLWIIGGVDEDVRYFEECKRLIEMFNLGDKVIFTGQVNIAEHLLKLDLVVLTSISEGQPLVMLESMAVGIPVVATNVGSCRELIEGAVGDELGAAGLVVPPNSPDNTAEAILRLLRNQALREQMGKVARQRVEQYYSQEKFIDNYRQLYQDVYAANKAGTK
ncbi:MAG: GT4 family glycosyltransferase PelF [Dethiobacter sp.]|nr:GT4 family glycosyltransferase PelF [Dethiobacter sp.]MBS3990245.1 GT4 family glycosyltransferase PelF [Dethiobacter sp.]